jgi:hypothetical protein
VRGGVLTRTNVPVLLATFGALSACVSHDAYPREWAATGPGSSMRCSDYQGDYREVGESTADRRARLSEFLDVASKGDLAGLRLDVDAEGRVAVRRLRLTSDGDVRMEDEPGIVLACKDGVLQFVPRSPARDGVFIGHSTGQSTWAKADDGALVVRFAGETLGTALVVIPVAASEVNWFRFRPLPR